MWRYSQPIHSDVLNIVARCNCISTTYILTACCNTCPSPHKCILSIEHTSVVRNTSGSVRCRCTTTPYSQIYNTSNSMDMIFNQEVHRYFQQKQKLIHADSEQNALGHYLDRTTQDCENSYEKLLYSFPWKQIFNHFTDSISIM